ncbi:hypothetical protein [Lacrimispora sp.]|nr:hypothetical protein [Lacrimispora sp.]
MMNVKEAYDLPVVIELYSRYIGKDWLAVIKYDLLNKSIEGGNCLE